MPQELLDLFDAIRRLTQMNDCMAIRTYGKQIFDRVQVAVQMNFRKREDDVDLNALSRAMTESTLEVEAADRA